MRKTTIALAFAALISCTASAQEKIKTEVQIFDVAPSRRYSVLSPVSASKGSTDKAFARMKDKAAKMGADAVIDVKCVAGDKVRAGFLQIRALGSDSVCQGVAVKWTD